MTRALIGYTGFVGGTLLRQQSFGALFNSRNIDDIRGGQFDEVVCAGAPAVKWLANKDPESDWKSIGGLIDRLATISARRFVLISTIDVYPATTGLTERDTPAPEGHHAYGRHRLALENFVAKRFESSLIVRLPALFGNGLKKNALYDLLHDNQTDKIVPNAAFQWYPMCRLSADLSRIESTDIRLINITSEPLSMDQVRDRFFPSAVLGSPVETPPYYDLRSIHDEILGGRNGYHLDKAQILAAMSDFIASSTCL
jgi:hypothetical protein